MARVDTFLEIVVEQSASDLHLHAGERPILRRHGELVRVPYRALTRGDARRLIYEILSPSQRAQVDARGTVDLVYQLDEDRFRINVCQQEHGVSAVMRRIDRDARTLEELNIPSSVKRLAKLQSGLVLVTGPTGSGKSTTLTSLVDSINRQRGAHILTIEDPIEFLHEPRRCVISQREVGRHAVSFRAAMKSALREAPDVIVIGELRDEQTIELALSAAETGILVLATVHTNSAVKSISRLIEAMPVDARKEARTSLSLTLRGVVSQTLCKRARGDGRIAAVEVLLWTDAVANMIREDKISQLDAYLRSQGPESGMQCLEHHLVRHCMAHLITEETAMLAAFDHVECKRLLERARALDASAQRAGP